MMRTLSNRRLAAPRTHGRTRTRARAHRGASNVCIVWNMGTKPGFRRNPSKEDLSEDKLVILDRIVEALTHPATGERPVLVLAGAAGTGKTTLMRVVIDELGKRGVSSILAAPTGKAAVRLKEVTGQPTSTVHRLIFSAPVNVAKCAACGQFSPDLGISAGAARRRDITEVKCPKCDKVYPVGELGRLEMGIQFSKGDISTPEDRTVVIIDEASMVSKYLDQRIRENLPPDYAILYVGDKEQLPPVGTGEHEEWGPDWANAVGTLTKVHRQAEGNPIINLATRIRENLNRKAPLDFVDLDAALPEVQRRVRVYRGVFLAQAARWLATGRMRGADATLIAYSNEERVQLNGMVRDLLGFTAPGNPPIVVGDRLMVLDNNYSAAGGQGMFNGEVFTVSEVIIPGERMRRDGLIVVKFKERGEDEQFVVPVGLMNMVDGQTGKREYLGLKKDLTSGFFALWRQIKEMAGNWHGLSRSQRDELSDLRSTVNLSAAELYEETGLVRASELIYADFGECITAHKSQGSQWNTVGVVFSPGIKARWFSSTEKTYENARRWLYTAVTRAQEKLVIFETVDDRRRSR